MRCSLNYLYRFAFLLIVTASLSVAGDVPGSVEFLKRSALPTLSR